MGDGLGCKPMVVAENVSRPTYCEEVLCCRELTVVEVNHSTYCMNNVHITSVTPHHICCNSTCLLKLFDQKTIHIYMLMV